jgi:class 3 adenylate cyclase
LISGGKRQSTEQRRLLAVLVADIVGYSRLMAENEADTFYRLKDFQNSLITPTTGRNHGRVVKWTGDGFIGTFDSAVDAVRAAIEIQSGVAAAGASAADDRRIRFRIGINTGDVITVPGDVYGDTVNVAARLQALAEPGGICISTGVRDAVRGKFSLEFENRGELNVKNIPDPVGTFDVVFDPIAWTMGRDVVPAKPATRPTRNLLAAGVVLLIGAAGAGGWYFFGKQHYELPATTPSAEPTPSSRSPATSSWQDDLSARMASAVPSLGGKALENAVDGYQTAKGHKAQAASPDPPGLWRAAARPSAENAETSALENCQINYGEPCTLVAVDEALPPLPADHNWPRRDMPRARYSGNFDPTQIPGSAPALREQADVLNYRSAPAPKAAVFTPVGGRLFMTVGATSQRSAEEESFRACDADPLRKGENGLCFLYAVGDRVVLPLRLSGPLTAMSTAPASSPLREALSGRLAAVVPNLPEKIREERVREYEAAHTHKAQAASPETPGTWRSAMRPTLDDAETATLEQCQVFFGKPCVLLAVDEVVQPVPPNGDWPRRDMARARYAGNFEPGQIPGLRPVARERADIANYRSAPGPKAAAYHPGGPRVFTVSGAASQRAAEQEALKACNSDPTRNGGEGWCFLYAVGDQVVLPRRLREPVTSGPAQ